MILKAKPKLTTSMTINQFENGYWYASELKNFAETIGIPSANKLRKDELEKAIICFLETGTIQSPTRRSLSPKGSRDTEKGLSLRLRVVNYTNERETKDFLEREARKIAPNFKRKSGARSRLKSLAGRADHQRRQDNLQGPGNSVREIEPNRALCPNPTPKIRQFHQ